MKKEELEPILKEFNQYFYKYKELIANISENSLLISEEDFLNVNGTEFNISLVMDDINEIKELPGNLLFFNLCFAEIEKTNLNEKEIKKIFPSFIKIQNICREFSQEMVIGKNVEDYISDEKNMKFKTILELGKYLVKIKKELFENLDNFIKEIKAYVNSIKIFEIDNTGIVKCFTNGGRKQNILIKSVKGNLYKIDILVESYASQSYAKLMVKDNSGFTVLKNINPIRDYNINIVDKEDFKQNAFEKIITNFKELIEKIER